MAFKSNKNETLNRNITVGSLVVIALVGLYFIFGQSAPQADAQVETVQAPVQEQVIEPQAPVEIENDQPESLGASSSGLGR